jgi:hypothetical protein
MHQRIAGFRYESVVCYQCHYDGTKAPKDVFVHDPFPIEKGVHSTIDCETCHVDSAERSVLGCTQCHGSQETVDTIHEGVTTYSFDGQQCYRCHPNGTG